MPSKGNQTHDAVQTNERILIMATKSFLSQLTPLDAQRLQKSVKATVQNSGRLTFAMDAVNEMQLTEDKSIIILAAGNGDLGAVISVKGDPEAFALKKCGAYFYVSFKNYLQQAGVDYKSQRIIYDITELDEKYKGRTLYKFERRILSKGDKEESDPTETAEERHESPPAAPETASTPSGGEAPTSPAPETADASAPVSAPSDAIPPPPPPMPPEEQTPEELQGGTAQ